MRRWLSTLLVFAFGCGEVSLTGLEERALTDAGDIAAVGSGYSRPATPADLPSGYPFAPDVGPEEVGGSGEAGNLLSLCDEGRPSRWVPRCSDSAACGLCEVASECGEGEVCSGGVCLPPTLPVADVEVIRERSLQLFGAPARLPSFWATVTRDGASVRRYFDVRRVTTADTKVSFAVYRQLVSASGEPLPEGSGEFVLEEQWVGGYADGSLLREALSLQVAAALTQQPVTLGEHRLVRVNGEVYGPMFTYRVADAAVLREAGLDDEVPRYAAEGSGELFAAGGAALVPLPGSRYGEVFVEESAARDDFAPLATLVEGAIVTDAARIASEPSSGACEVRRVLDVDGYLDGLALLALLGDGGHARTNYRLSLQPRNGTAGRWQVWYDTYALSFGCRWNEADDNGLCGSMDPSESPYSGMVEDGSNGAIYPPSSYYNLLTDLVLRDRELESAFRARICGMLASTFWQEVLPRRIAAMGALLAPAASVDPRDRVDGADGYRSEVEALQAYYTSRTQLLRSQFLCF